MKNMPKFKSEKEEREFWESHDSTEFLDWSNAKPVSFPNLKPTRKSISIRLPADLLEQYKTLANKEDVPYQSLMKMVLAEHLKHKSEKPRTRKATGGVRVKVP